MLITATVSISLTCGKSERLLQRIILGLPAIKRQLTVCATGQIYTFFGWTEIPPGFHHLQQTLARMLTTSYREKKKNGKYLV